MAERRTRTPSVASSRTSKGSRTTQEHEIEAIRKIAELESKLSIINRDILQTEARLADVAEDIQEITSSQTPNEERLTSLQKEQKDLTRKLRNLKIDDTFASCDLEREKKTLEKVQKIQTSIDEEESNSQDVSEDEDEASKYDEAASRTSTEFNEELTRRLLDLKGFGPEEKPSPEEKVKTTTSSKNNESSSTEMTELVKALTQATMALTAASTKPESKTNDKFLARQSHAKELPFFSGKADEWPSFKSAFDRSTEICGFSNSENMCRLQKCLKGDALEFVKCLLVSPENVKTVLDTLEMRFGRPEHIIKSLFEKVKEVPKVREDKLQTLIQFGSVVTNLTSTIKSLNRPNYANNSLIVEELEGKLPNNYVMEWVTWVRNEPTRERNLDYFARWLSCKMEIACEIVPPSVTENKGKCEEKRDDKKKKSFTQQVYYNADAEDEKEAKNKQQKETCSRCSGNGHSITICKQFLSEDTDKRWEQVKKNRLCFQCLKKGHGKLQCKSSDKCGVNGCGRSHHELLHQTPRRSNSPQGEVEAPAAQVSGNVRTGTKKLLKVVPVTLRGPKGTVQTFALLDDGSMGTLIREDISRRLGLQGVEEKLCLQWIDNSKKENNSMRVSVHIKGEGDGLREYLVRDVNTVEDLRIPEYNLDIANLKKRWPYLKPLEMKSIIKGQATMIIGIDNAKLIAHRRILEGPATGPVAVKTWLGWAVGGRCGGTFDGVLRTYHICQKTESDQALHDLVKDYFTTESFGVKLNEEKPKSRCDHRALAILDATSSRIDGGRWQTGLLWKQEDCVLPSSKQNALNRLLCQERRMDRDPDFAQQYCRKIEEYVQKGFVSKLTEETAAIHGPRTWYLPHFGVYHPHKPGKLRLVFDAAAKSGGVSLNSALLTGPDLLNSLQAVLMRFRENRIAFTGDITDMFHRVLIREEDKNSQRFLWRGMNRDSPPDTYVMDVMIFGATSSPSAAMYIKNRNAEEFREQYPEAVEEIIRNFYMDDYLGGAEDEKSASKLIEEVIKVNDAAGMNLCKFISNSTEVTDSLPQDRVADGMKNLNEKAEIPTERVLGLWWDPTTDEFTFKVNYHKVPAEILEGKKIPTKRDISRLVSSIYDPLGFVSPFKVKGLSMLQAAWRNEVGWDDEIPGTLFELWKQWLEELPQLKDVRVKRCYSENLRQAEEIQLHTFVDASDEAYTAVAYLRITHRDGVEVGIVASKVRIAPIKKLTVPRMELMAALMGVRLARTIKEELTVKVHRSVYWSDSSTVLSWIRSEEGRFPQFIANRVGEIHEKSEQQEWKWIPTLLNVADDATRASRPIELKSDSRWLTGPSFLPLDEEFWPVEKSNVVSDEDMEYSTFVMLGIESDPADDLLPDINRFSSWLRLVRATAAVRVAATVWKKRNDNKRETLPITLEDMRMAELQWWRRSQLESFPEEVRRLQNGLPVDKKSKLSKLSVVLDTEGVIRLTGRVGNCREISQETKQPVVLDPKHQFVRMLLDYHHKEGAHQGQERLVNNLRSKYWILDIRTAVRSTWNRCGDCQLKRAKPVNPQIGDLPHYRLQSGNRPFYTTGVDYFGPIEVTIGRRREKRWGVVFTCLVTRGIHLELAPSLETDQMIMALMRFINRRGRPAHLHSDNGTNFRGADVELKTCLKELNQEKIEAVTTNMGIKWHFIPPSAPHFGGAWERMVGLVKKTLMRLLKEQAPREYTLLTLLTEVENIVNSRPLTHVSLDPDDDDSLTPNHFLRHSNFQGPSIDVETSDSDLILRRQWRKAQRLADHFWTRWLKEYVPSLLKKEKWLDAVPEIRVGDVVILMSDQLPRNNWPKGIIEQIFPGKDGITRVVDVRTATGVYRRPVSKICPLKIRTESPGDLHGGRNVCEGDEDHLVSCQQEDQNTPSA